MLKSFLRSSDLFKKRQKRRRTLNIRMTDATHARLAQLAAMGEEGTTRTDVVRHALVLYEALATTPRLRLFVKIGGGQLEEVTSLLRDP